MLFHVRDVVFVCRLHLQVTAPMQVLTDANTLPIDSLHEGTYSGGCDSLWVCIASMVLVVWSLEVIVTAWTPFCLVFYNFRNFCIGNIVETILESSVELMHVVGIMVCISIEVLLVG